MESRPPRIAAGKARSATACRPGCTPGVGEPTRNRPATAASAPPTTQASADTRPSRMPMSAAVSPSSAAARIATPQSEYLKTAKKPAMSTAATPMAMSRFSVMPTSPNRTHLAAPRVADVEDVGADPAGQLGDQQDVDADGEDRQADDRRAAQPVDEHPLDEQRRARRWPGCPANGRPEAQLGGEPGDRVGAEQQQRAVHEAHDLAGLEDDREAERDEHVDGAEGQAVEQQGQELGHAGASGLVSVGGLVGVGADPGRSRRRSRGRPG